MLYLLPEIAAPDLIRLLSMLINDLFKLTIVILLKKRKHELKVSINMAGKDRLISVQNRKVKTIMINCKS